MVVVQFLVPIYERDGRPYSRDVLKRLQQELEEPLASAPSRDPIASDAASSLADNMRRPADSLARLRESLASLRPKLRLATLAEKLEIAFKAILISEIRKFFAPPSAWGQIKTHNIILSKTPKLSFPLFYLIYLIFK